MQRLKYITATLFFTLITTGYSVMATENTDNNAPAIEGWAEFVEALAAMPDALLGKLPESMREDPQIQQQVGQLILQALTLSSLNALGSDGDNPVFLPQIGQVLNVGQPNADTIYKAAQITPGGSYRLRGHAGRLNHAVIGQVGPTPADLNQEGEHAGPTRNYLFLDSLQLDDSGHFDVLLSPAKPDGYEGDWWPLHPKTYRLMLRQVSSDWAAEQDPTISIERLDQPAPATPPPAGQLAGQLGNIHRSTAFMAGMFVDKVELLRQEGYTNKLKVFDVSKIGGLEGQFYYEGAYELADDEALIIAAEHPAQCQYRSLLLTNEVYQTTDWYNHHSSLNDAQAAIDDDGILRIVVSAQDPGVPNWLDTAGHPRGVIQGRWTNCDSQPVPSVERVKLAELRQHLPENTPTISAAERAEIISRRRAAYQQRRHW